MPATTTVSRATLNRTTLARQALLDRADESAATMIERLVGLQAQEPLEPYVGLWSRLATFAPAELVGLLERREAVRTLMMRRTLHLHTAADALRFRPVHHAMIVQRTASVRAREISGLDPDRLAEVAEPRFDEPRTTSEVARAVAAEWPDVPIPALSDLVSVVVPLVQVPPRGIWGRRAAARNLTLAGWLGDVEPAPAEEVLDELVLRYLAAYGPATSSDVRAWSGLAGLPAVIKRLRPRLRSYRDDAGRELLDLADAELTPADRPAPPRFLPAFDNVVLGYADRSRMIDDEHKHHSVAGARFVLLDGRVAGVWTSTGDAESGVTVEIEPFRPLPQRERTALTAEAERLAAFLGDGTEGRVSYLP
ncbi:winged helix DNA-binding domain-containing protein [Microlunatus sp. GCM10028923]|uniref:winged helix DNA-binding domain-containing protein n=1 Tax=Microlunatus sp. GCM10028923 TaxID=3273400 RepID=UPI00361742B6